MKTLPCFACSCGCGVRPWLTKAELNQGTHEIEFTVVGPHKVGVNGSLTLSHLRALPSDFVWELDFAGMALSLS